MNLRSWARVLIAVSFLISGLVETLSATGLVVELSPGGGWGPGVHTVAVSGPLQMVGAALIAFSSKARWVAGILGCYFFLVSIFGNLPLVFDPQVGGSAIAGLLINLVVMGVALSWLQSERIPGDPRAKSAPQMTDSATTWPTGLLVCHHPSGPQPTAPGQVTPHAAALHCQ